MSLLALSIEYLMLVALFEVFKQNSDEQKTGMQNMLSDGYYNNSLYGWKPLTEFEIEYIRSFTN